MGRQGHADDLRSLADNIEGLEEDYDNLVAELEDSKNELDRLNEIIISHERYITWAESFYPDMAGQYQALMKLGE